MHDNQALNLKYFMVSYIRNGAGLRKNWKLWARCSSYENLKFFKLSHRRNRLNKTFELFKQDVGSLKFWSNSCNFIDRTGTQKIHAFFTQSHQVLNLKFQMHDNQALNLKYFMVSHIRNGAGLRKNWKLWARCSSYENFGLTKRL